MESADANKTGESDFSPGGGGTEGTKKLLLSNKGPLPHHHPSSSSSSSNKLTGFVAKFPFFTRRRDRKGQTTRRSVSRTAKTPPLAEEESSGLSDDDDDYEEEDKTNKGKGKDTTKGPYNNSNVNTSPSAKGTNEMVPPAMLIIVKEGYLMKQTSSFQRWHRRYLKIKGRKLYYGKDEKAQVWEEIDISQVTVATSSSSSCKYAFQVITPSRVLQLGTDKREEMEEWVQYFKKPSDLGFYEGMERDLDNNSMFQFQGDHIWTVTSHSRPTYCNVCSEQLCGLTSHGLSCEICKFKAHKKCAIQANGRCKWATLSSMKDNAILETDGTVMMPHQWVEGNLAVKARCRVCDKSCGSVLRLQDYRCLWCFSSVHSSCMTGISKTCKPRLISVIPPVALHTLGNDESWIPTRPFMGCSPLLVFVNSKSGDHQGLKFLMKFRQLLNPAQVFDLVGHGPGKALQVFRHFSPFRILVCGGDGSVGWVLTGIDKYDLHRECRIGILPLGTGNDLARVLGWGASCDDDIDMIQFLERYERATTRMLDRWSVQTHERRGFSQPDSTTSILMVRHLKKEKLAKYEDDILYYLGGLEHCETPEAMSHGTKILHELLLELREEVRATFPHDDEIEEKSMFIRESLTSLLEQLGFAGLKKDVDLVVVGEDGEEMVKENGDDVNLSSLNNNANSNLSNNSNASIFLLKKQTSLETVRNLKQAVKELVDHAEHVLDKELLLENHEGGGEPMITTTTISTPKQRPTTLKMEEGDEDNHEIMMDEENEIELVLQPTTVSIPPEQMQQSTIRLPVPASPLNGETTTTGSSSGNVSPMDLSCNNNLEVPNQERKYSNASSNSSIPGEMELEDEIVGDEHEDHEDDHWEIRNGEDHDHDDHTSSMIPRPCPKIEIESPSSSSPRKGGGGGGRKSSDLNLSEEGTDVDISLDLPGRSSATIPTSSSSPGASPSPMMMVVSSSSGALEIPYGASRRVSQGSLLLLKPSSGDMCPLDIPSNSSDTPDGFLTGGTMSCSSAMSSPNKSSHDSHSNSQQYSKRKFPILNPLICDPSWAGESEGAGFVEKMLLQTTDTAGAVASPLMSRKMECDDTDLAFGEKCVMNNYFGIGIDAKITLDFHLKREEHPEKCRSRARNFIWYGVLGGKELLQRSCKNLNRRIELVCDGHRITLPTLQGIVILNIQSFMGGTNFWGGRKEDSVFVAPSYDDKVLEVVAVFDTMQMAASRLVRLRHHRILQCRSLRITVFGQDPIPVQVDGEAWLQAPGVIKIVHKNRVQMLCRSKELESSLRSWKKKMKQKMPNHHGSLQEDSTMIPKKTGKRFAIGFHNKRKDSSDGSRDETSCSYEGKPIEHWTALEVSEWLEQFQTLCDYKDLFFRHDITGKELVALHPGDLKELGVSSTEHVKMILSHVKSAKKLQGRASQ